MSELIKLLKQSMGWTRSLKWDIKSTSSERKLNTFSFLQDIIMRKKSKATDWKKRLAKYISDKRLYPEYRKYSYYSVRQTIQFKNGQKIWTDFTK